MNAASTVFAVRRSGIAQRSSPLDPEVLAALLENGPDRTLMTCRRCRAHWRIAGELAAALDVGCPECGGEMRSDR